jgi:uncharacterized membrane protein
MSKQDAGRRRSARTATLSLMIFAFALLVVTIWLVHPSATILHRALLVGLLIAVLDFAFSLYAIRTNIWTFGGAWRVFGYPVSMGVGWLFLTAVLCLILGRLPGPWTKILITLLAASGGAVWEIRVHIPLGILIPGRATRSMIFLYWLVLAGLAAYLVS